MTLTLKERLVKWLKAQKDWVPSGELQRVVAHSTSYTPQNVGRRMRELENDGVVAVKYIKNHAHYRIATGLTIQETMAAQVKWFDAI